MLTRNSAAAGKFIPINLPLTFGSSSPISNFPLRGVFVSKFTLKGRNYSCNCSIDRLRMEPPWEGVPDDIYSLLTEDFPMVHFFCRNMCYQVQEMEFYMCVKFYMCVHVHVCACMHVYMYPSSSRCLQKSTDSLSFPEVAVPGSCEGPTWVQECSSEPEKSSKHPLPLSHLSTP